jgi:hypothetical protein
MIPAGYIDSIVHWARRPDLSDGQKVERQTTLLDEHDRLVTGQLTGKAGRTLIGGSLNGKSFSWAPEVTAAEKSVVITAVLDRLDLLDPEAKTPTLIYGRFDQIVH